MARMACVCLFTNLLIIMKAKDQRRFLRWLHLLSAAVIGTYVYAPWKEVLWFSLTVQVLIVPGLTATGIWLWLGPKIGRRFIVRTEVTAGKRPAGRQPGESGGFSNPVTRRLISSII
jgi:hypothetical protein